MAQISLKIHTFPTSGSNHEISKPPILQNKAEHRKIIDQEKKIQQCRKVQRHSQKTSLQWLSSVRTCIGVQGRNLHPLKFFYELISIAPK